jgi:hypothetical protein
MARAKYDNDQTLKWPNITMAEYYNGQILKKPNMAMAKYCFVQTFEWPKHNFFRHFLALGTSGCWTRTVDLMMKRQVFYHCAITTDQKEELTL